MDVISEVTRKRAADTVREVREHYPEAKVRLEVRGRRGIITAYLDTFVLSKEFVETDDTLDDPKLLYEYSQVLRRKARLVVVVPRHRAAAFRLKLLELNNNWLSYYQLHYYGDEGDIRRVDRETWRRLMSLPPEETRNELD